MINFFFKLHLYLLDHFGASDNVYPWLFGVVSDYVVLKTKLCFVYVQVWRLAFCCDVVRDYAEQPCTTFAIS